MGGGRNMKKQSKRDWRVRRLKQTGARTSAALRHGTMEGWTCPASVFPEAKAGPPARVLILGCLAPAERTAGPARTARKARDARAVVCTARCPHLYSCRPSVGRRWTGGGDADKQEHELLPGARVAAYCMSGAAVCAYCCCYYCDCYVQRAWRGCSAPSMTASGGTVLTCSGPTAIVSNIEQHDCRTHAAAYERPARSPWAASEAVSSFASIQEGRLVGECRRCASHKQSLPYSASSGLPLAAEHHTLPATAPLAAPSLACMISERLPGRHAGAEDLARALPPARSPMLSHTSHSPPQAPFAAHDSSCSQRTLRIEHGRPVFR